MLELNFEIGQRLKLVRHFFNEGKKLSAEQFGHLLGETRDNIANYESGRAGLPVRVLFELYQRGINPVFLISGGGDVFADNEIGNDFKSRLERRNIDIGKVLPFKKVDYNEGSTIKVLKVAAGSLPNNASKS